MTMFAKRVAHSSERRTPPRLPQSVKSRWRHVLMRKLSQSRTLRSFASKVATAFGVRISLIKPVGSVSVPMNADDSLARVESALSHLSPIEPNTEISGSAQWTEDSKLSIAVIVPTFGDQKFLRDCLRSLLTQTYTNWVCYIVDDASPDSVDGAIKDIIKNDDRFVLIRHTRNRGLAAARNTALSVAHEDLVQFLDADDLLTPWSLENRLNALRQAGEGFAGAHGQILQCTEETLLEDVSKWGQTVSLEERNFASSDCEAPFNVHAPLMRTSIAREVGGFNEAFRNGAEDWEFWSRVLSTGARFAGADRIAGAYRQRAQSMIRHELDDHLRRAEELLDRADLQARWSTGEIAPLALGYSEMRRQERLVRRKAVWSGISGATAALRGELFPCEKDLALHTVEESALVAFLRPGVVEQARRGLIRGFGLSPNCEMRLSDHAKQVIAQMSHKVADEILESISELESSLQTSNEFLVVDQTLPEDVVFIALTKPRDAQLVEAAHLDLEKCVFIDLSSEGGHQFQEDTAHRTISLSEFLLQWRSSSPASIIASSPLHPVLRSEEVTDISEVKEVALYAEDLNSDVEAETFRGSYRTVFAREESDLPDRSFEELGLLKNAHQGETCVIVGNGPSLNLTDMQLVSKFPYFAVNSFFLLEDKIERPPDFYVVEDTAVFKDNFEEIVNFEAELKLFPTMYKEKLLSARTAEELGNPLFFRMNQGFYGRRTGALGYPRFSQDASQRVFCGQSVTIINLQLAYWMGFSKVLLVGMDFSYQIPADAKVDGNIIVSQSDDPNHFDPRYFGAGKTWKDPKLSRVLQNYRLAKEVFEADGRQILNCTVGGALELFERSTLDEMT